MQEPHQNVGNGLILYFRTQDLKVIRQKAEEFGYHIEEEVRENPNSKKLEFSLRDIDGYFLIISEYHKFEG